MSPEEAVAALDAIESNADPESTHAEADSILLNVVDDEVADAYNRLILRTRWWVFS